MEAARTLRGARVALLPIAASLSCGFPSVALIPDAPDGAAADVASAPPAAQTGEAAADGTPGASPSAEGGSTGTDGAPSGGSAGAADGGPLLALDADASASGADAFGDGAPPSDASVDCSCNAIDMYPVLTTCGLLGTGLLVCTPGGFVGNPKCGESGEFITCVVSGLGCGAVSSTRVQQCMPHD